jgi:hypothetical protein
MMYGISLSLTFLLLLIPITAEMAQAPVRDFRALLQRFGFSQDGVQAILDNGIRTTPDLIGIDTDDIENLVKIIRASRTPPMLVSYIAQKRLSVLAYWVNRLRRLGESIAALDFTEQAAEDAGKLMAFES